MKPQDINALAAELAHGMTLEQLRAKQNALSEGRRFTPEPTPEQAEKIRQYWEQVQNTPPQSSAPVYVRSTRPEAMKYDEARRTVWKLVCERAEQLGHTFTFTDEQAAVIRRLIQYFINDAGGGLDLTKGIFLYGSPGCGKTEIMLIMQAFCEQHEFAKSFSFSNMAEVYAGAIADKNSDPVTPNIQFDRCFDDVGMKAGEVNLYGNMLDINEAIIYQRYLRNRRFGQLTHFVSNLDSTQIKGVLTERVYDRMRDLCQSVKFPGDSNRGKKSAQ